MKKFLLLIVCALIFASCNFTEEITFKEDGSGEFIMSYDLSEAMKVMNDMDKDEEEVEPEEQEGEADNQESEERNNQPNKRPGMKMDSTMYFKDMLVEKADSISNLPQTEQDRLRSLKDVVIKMKMDEDAGILNFGVGSSFINISALPQALEKIEQAKEMNSGNNREMSQMENSAIAKASENMFEYIDYKYNGKTFSRILKDNYKQSAEDVKALNAEISRMGESSEEQFNAMTYTLVYHFPRAVKSVSNNNATLSDDKKTVTLKMNFIDMLKTPAMMALDVVLEN